MIQIKACKKCGHFYPYDTSIIYSFLESQCKHCKEKINNDNKVLLEFKNEDEYEDFLLKFHYSYNDYLHQ